MSRLLLSVTLLLFLAGPTTANNLNGVYINEVLYNPVGTDAGNQKMEIINLGGSTVTLTDWSICIGFNYKRFPAGHQIAPGGIYTIHINATGTNTANEMYTGPYTNIDAASDGISLYHTFFGFGTPGNMEDFVQFGAGAQPRENVAVAAGLWTAGTFVPLGVEGQSVSYNGALTLPHPTTDYCNEAPTIGLPNVCGSGGSMGTLADLRINEVLADPIGSNSTNTRVEIINTSPDPVDLDNLTMLHQADFYSIPPGSTVPGDGLVVLFLNEDGSDTDGEIYTGQGVFPDLNPLKGSFVLFSDSTGLGEADSLLDFFQWGQPGQEAESLAVVAGLWNMGEFFGGTYPEGSGIQWLGGGDGTSVTEYCVDSETIGSANSCTISGVPGDRPRLIQLGRNHPNPFRPSTSIRFDMAVRHPRVAVAVYDIRGTLVRRLMSGPAESGPIELVWDGRDEAGRRLQSGIYFYSVAAGSERATGKMTLVR